MKQKGTIIMLTQINNDCGHIDPLGECPVSKCFDCRNADYRITLEDGKIIRDFKYYGTKGKRIEVNKYLIEFFDEVDLENIESYLTNYSSDYRLTRLSDNCVLIPSKTDIRLNNINKLKSDLQMVGSNEIMLEYYILGNKDRLKEILNDEAIEEELKEEIKSLILKVPSEIAGELLNIINNIDENLQNIEATVLTKKKSRFGQFISKITGK